MEEGNDCEALDQLHVAPLGVLAGADWNRGWTREFCATSSHAWHVDRAREKRRAARTIPGAIP